MVETRNRPRLHSLVPVVTQDTHDEELTRYLTTRESEKTCFCRNRNEQLSCRVIFHLLIISCLSMPPGASGHRHRTWNKKAHV